MDNDGNRRMDEWTNLTPPTTSLCAVKKKTTTNLLERCDSLSCMYDAFRSYLDDCDDDLFRRQTYSIQAIRRGPSPGASAATAFWLSPSLQNKVLTYVPCRSPSLPVPSGEQDVLQACADNLALSRPIPNVSCTASCPLTTTTASGEGLTFLSEFFG